MKNFIQILLLAFILISCSSDERFYDIESKKNTKNFKKASSDFENPIRLFESFCGTQVNGDRSSPLSNVSEINAFINSIAPLPQPNNNPFGSMIRIVRIKYHIVRMSDGTGGDVSVSELNTLTNRLNSAFGLLLQDPTYSYGGQNQPPNAARIKFSASEINYIDDTSLYDIIHKENISQGVLYQRDRDPEMLNIYIPNTFRILKLNGSISLTGDHAEAEDIGSNALIITRNILNKYYLAHEIGHCLGLYHTFQDSISDCPEPIEIHSSTTGDLIADTPYDFGLETTHYQANYSSVPSCLNTWEARIIGLNAMSYVELGNDKGFSRNQFLQMRAISILNTISFEVFEHHGLNGLWSEIY
jgi:hypothetical protein